MKFSCVARSVICKVYNSLVNIVKLWKLSYPALHYASTPLAGNELYTNLGLAFVAVFIVTLLLVANIWICLLVCLSVIVTLVIIIIGFVNTLNAVHQTCLDVGAVCM